MTAKPGKESNQMKETGRVLGKGFGGILIIFGILVGIGAMEMMKAANGFTEVVGAGFMLSAICLAGMGCSCISECSKIVVYHRDGNLDRVRYIRMEFRGPGDTVTPMYEVSPVFSKIDGVYSYFIDSSLMTLKGTEKRVAGLYDENKRPLPMSYHIEVTGKAENDFGFVEIWP